MANCRCSLRTMFSFLLSGFLATAFFAVAGGFPVQEKGQIKEEEDPVKPKKRAPITVEDREAEAKSAPSTKSAAPQPLDFAAEAKLTKSIFLKAIYEELALVHDLIQEKRRESPMRVKPIARLQPDGESGNFKVVRYDEKNKEVNSTVTWANIVNITPYETLGLEKVNRFLERELDKSKPTSPTYMTRLAQLREAERMLSALTNYHDSAIESGVRIGAGWTDVETQLKNKLQSVQLDQLRLLMDQMDWQSALDMGTRLAETYPDKASVRDEIVRALAKGVAEPFKHERFAEAGKRFAQLDERFGDNKELQGVRQDLMRQAGAILDDFTKLEKLKDITGAANRLERIKEIYPQYPGLQDLYSRVGNTSPALFVGVRELPEEMSPVRAATESERQAVDLIFESLVRVVNLADGTQRFATGLAEDRPRMLPLGRSFQIPRNVFWSDGRRQITAVDVRRTIALLSDAEHGRQSTEWIDMMRDSALIPKDSSHIRLTMNRGALDPLAYMDFKILPQDLDRADSSAFSRAPIGSGPYIARVRDRDAIRLPFAANPHYEARPGKSGKPNIREITFTVSESPAQDLKSGKMQLLLDFPTSTYRTLESEPAKNYTIMTLRNRRIYFLALNSRRAKLQSRELRLAIAHAVNREDILEKHFRSGLQGVHRPLNGPFPPDSWAAPSGKKPDLYNPELAISMVERAKAKKATMEKLSLKYPTGDPAVAQACNAIREQAAKAGLELELVARSPRELHIDVKESHDYDLAYFHHDYATEAFPLWDLFDPNVQARGGANYLGYYKDDAELDSCLQKLKAHRDIARLRENMHQIHDVICDNMPFVPLWQLDSHLAIHKNLKIAGTTDPHHIFTHVENWELSKRP